MKKSRLSRLSLKVLLLAFLASLLSLFVHEGFTALVMLFLLTYFGLLVIRMLVRVFRFVMRLVISRDNDKSQNSEIEARSSEEKTSYTLDKKQILGWEKVWLESHGQSNIFDEPGNGFFDRAVSVHGSPASGSLSLHPEFGMVSQKNQISDVNDVFVNPATGLPMIGGGGGVDVAGNPFGADLNDDRDY